MSDLIGSLNVTLIKGSSRTLRLTVLDQDGDAVNLSSPAATLYFTVRRKEGDPDPALIEKDSGTPTQIEILTPQTDPDKKGIANIYIEPADTSGLAPDQYRYDVWAEIGTKRYVIIPPSTFEVRPSVTVLP